MQGRDTKKDEYTRLKALVAAQNPTWAPLFENITEELYVTCARPAPLAYSQLDSNMTTIVDHAKDNTDLEDRPPGAGTIRRGTDFRSRILNACGLDRDELEKHSALKDKFEGDYNDAIIINFVRSVLLSAASPLSPPAATPAAAAAPAAVPAAASVVNPANAANAAPAAQAAAAPASSAAPSVTNPAPDPTFVAAPIREADVVYAAPVAPNSTPAVAVPAAPAAAVAAAAVAAAAVAAPAAAVAAPAPAANPAIAAAARAAAQAAAAPAVHHLDYFDNEDVRKKMNNMMSDLFNVAPQNVSKYTQKLVAAEKILVAITPNNTEVAKVRAFLTQYESDLLTLQQQLKNLKNRMNNANGHPIQESVPPQVPPNDWLHQAIQQLNHMTKEEAERRIDMYLQRLDHDLAKVDELTESEVLLQTTPNTMVFGNLKPEWTRPANTTQADLVNLLDSLHPQANADPHGHGDLSMEGDNRGPHASASRDHTYAIYKIEVTTTPRHGVSHLCTTGSLLTLNPQKNSARIDFKLFDSAEKFKDDVFKGKGTYPDGIPGHATTEWAAKNIEILREKIKPNDDGTYPPVRLNAGQPPNNIPDNCVRAIMLYCKFKGITCHVRGADIKINDAQFKAMKEQWLERHPHDTTVTEEHKGRKEIIPPSPRPQRVAPQPAPAVVPPVAGAQPAAPVGAGQPAAAPVGAAQPAIAPAPQPPAASQPILAAIPPPAPPPPPSPRASGAGPARRTATPPRASSPARQAASPTTPASPATPPAAPSSSATTVTAETTPSTDTKPSTRRP